MNPGSSVKRSPATPVSSPARSASTIGDRLAKRGERALLLDAEAVEPRALREAEERATSGNEVEHRDLAGDLVRVQRERVERCRPQADALRHASHEQQRPDRRLVEQVVVDGEHVDARVLGAARERLVLVRSLIRPDTDAELARYVSSSVTSVRSPIRSMRITTRSSGSGHATSESCSSQSSSGRSTHLRRQQRQHRLDRVEAEVLPGGDAHAARLRDLEEVADLEPADGAAFDPLDGHAEVVEPHLGHLAGNLLPLARVRGHERARRRPPRARGTTGSTRGSCSCSCAWRSSW